MLRKKVWAYTYAVYLQQNAGYYNKTKVANKSFDRMVKLKYLGTMFTILLRNKLKADEIRRIPPNIPLRTFCINVYNPKI
jgi:hypothetical protein